MPAVQKKAKGGKKDSKKKDKKGLKGLQTISELLKVLRIQYDAKCKDEQSFPLPTVRNSIKQYEEKSEFLVKVRNLVRLGFYCIRCRLPTLNTRWTFKNKRKLLNTMTPLIITIIT